MSQHPLAESTYSTTSQESTDSYPAFSEEDISDFVRRVSSPIPRDDSIVRAASPFGRRYLKPINGIQTKGFARSAQRRSSVMTLGSIERLQDFYAKRELKLNKGGTLGFQKLMIEEEDDYDERLPTPKAPPPSWINLDVETDLDVLLNTCFEDIQHTLTAWAMVMGPRQSSSSSSSSSHPLSSDSADESSRATTPIEPSFDILPLIQSVTRMLDSVRNYTTNRHDLSDTALSKLRQASLSLLEAMKELENQYREDGNDEEGYVYKSSDFDLLERERQAIHTYLRVVESQGFNPPHHIGSPPAVFTPEIQALMGKTSILSLSDSEEDTDEKAKVDSSIPVWLERGSFVNDPLGRYHALLVDNQDKSLKEVIDISNPKDNENAFLECLADGRVLCNAYNSLVKQSKRPFGFITKIHSDTRRTYRAVENLRFFVAFEIVFNEFDPSEIARKTDKGLIMMKSILATFCECAIRELREQIDLIQKQK
ncbi:hypothetical protein G6F37_004234 [Rhizopus arrhizus]|nr:hypothetical protein G6F38_002565 [Rhizopus arrhizus]KAG1160166.1 hypothetical protein G6F37_004234 [Rhizopus arrhizus]